MIWKSESCYQHQNFSERRYHRVKCLDNTIIDRTGAPAYTWLIDLIYICFLLNHTHNSGINGITITKATGSNADISPLFSLHFCQPIYYNIDDSDLPS